MTPRAELWGRSVSPYLLLTLTMLFWSGNGIIGRAASADVPPMALSFWRWTIAFCLFLPFSWNALVREWPTIRRHWRIIGVFGVLSVTLFTIINYNALSFSTAINVTLVSTIIPVVIVIMNWLWFDEHITWRGTVGTLLALAGVVTIIARGDSRLLLSLQVNLGDVLMLAGVVVWALYSVLLRFRPANLGGTAFLAALMIPGVILNAPLYLAEIAWGPPVRLSVGNAAMIGYLGVFPSLLAYVCYNAGVKAVGASVAGQFNYLVPVFVSVLAVLLLGERFEVFHAIGMIAIFAGLYLATRPRPAG
ncbi:MAG: DMT family transporter [Alphaproteobacteria bacterium]|nr:DMT family transporter [Alphaproteobacteria bacterium]